MMKKTAAAFSSLAIAGVLLGAASSARAADGTPSDPVKGSKYYTVHPIFNPYPSARMRGTFKINHFGPVGIGIELGKPPFTMKITNVEPGSPAAATGKLKAGQMIELINGKPLKDKDPRVILGDIITEAEATDGRIRLKIKGEGEVTVKIPVMGRYSKTWPLNCRKSDKIVRNLADLIAKQSKPKWGSALFLLSTGEEKDLDIVRKWMTGIKTIGNYPWHKGYLGLGLCEYYLRTGDRTILPVIKKMTEELKVLMYNGSWSGRGYARFGYMGGGHMNAAGVHCVTFLLLAKMCGVDVDEYMLQRSLMQFFRFAGRGNVAYGDQLPEGGFRDNGKTGGLAVAMAVAARLTPNGERSIYARARDNSAMKSFYATSWFHAAHTGGGIGEIWHNVAMGLMHERRPKQYRSFMDERRWVMELSREFNGGIGIGGYDKSYDDSAADKGARSWGTYFALAYTLPRKTLQLSGAPKTEWCKTYRLPTRPWGTPADDIFQSLEPAKHSSISMRDLLREVVPTDASYPVVRRINDPKVSDNTLLKYVHHPDFGLRSAAMRSIVRLGRKHLVLPLLKSSDPRIRHVGLLAITGMFKGKPLPTGDITPEMFDLVGKMIEDPDESLWVLQDAMNAIKRADPKIIARHKNRLLEIMKRDDWWLRKPAIEALSYIATDKSHYAQVLPQIIERFSEFKVSGEIGTIKGLAKSLGSADSRVKATAFGLLKEAYADVPDARVWPGGRTMPDAANAVRTNIGGAMSKLPGGIDFVRTTPKMTMQATSTGRDADRYTYSGRFKSNRELAGKWLLVTSASTAADVEKRLQSKAKALEREKKQSKNTPKKKKKKKKKKKNFLELKDGGLVGRSKTRFWSGDMLVDVNTNEALKMEIKTIAGKKYLLVEKGGFSKPDAPEGWHCGYNVYERAK